MTDNSKDILHMIDDTGRLAALRNAGRLSGMAMSAHQSNLLANDVEFCGTQINELYADHIQLKQML